MQFTDTFVGRPNTKRTYESLYRKHLSFPGQTIDWINWSELSTLATLREWDDKGLSSATRITLTRLLGRLVRHHGGPDIGTASIIKSLTRGEQQREVTVLTRDEAGRLAEVTKTIAPLFYPVLLLALHAGLRRGEIFGLRCADVDLLSGRVKVSHSYSGPTKNGKSRLVPMGPELSKALTDARNLLLRGPETVVFERFDPNPILRRVCNRAGIKRIRFHDLRHTFASMALTAGVNPKQVADWLGHSSVVTTLSIYWNLAEERADLSFLPNEQRNQTA